jgi:hypothetical protein
MATGPQKLESHRSDVPADYVDPNHPHFPTEIEGQLPPRPYYKRVNKNALLIIGAIILVIVSAVVGGKFGAGLAKRPVMSSTASKTVYSTTTIITTSSFTGGKAFEMISVTSTFAQTSSLVSSTTLTTSMPATETSKAHPPEQGVSSSSLAALISGPPKFKKQCYSTGRWPSLEECNKQCAINNKPGQEAHCEVDTNAVIKCIICKL